MVKRWIACVNLAITPFDVEVNAGRHRRPRAGSLG
jgi:hypothetical protein